MIFSTYFSFHSYFPFCWANSWKKNNELLHKYRCILVAWVDPSIVNQPLTVWYLESNGLASIQIAETHKSQVAIRSDWNFSVIVYFSARWNNERSETCNFSVNPVANTRSCSSSLVLQYVTIVFHNPPDVDFVRNVGDYSECLEIVTSVCINLSFAGKGIVITSDARGSI